VIDVVCAVTGKGHANQAVDVVDRTNAQVNVQVGTAWPPEFIEDRQRLTLWFGRVKQNPRFTKSPGAI
jgi:hypothetical protein